MITLAETTAYDITSCIDYVCETREWIACARERTSVSCSIRPDARDQPEPSVGHGVVTHVSTRCAVRVVCKVGMYPVWDENNS